MLHGAGGSASRHLAEMLAMRPHPLDRTDAGARDLLGPPSGRACTTSSRRPGRHSPHLPRAPVEDPVVRRDPAGDARLAQAAVGVEHGPRHRGRPALPLDRLRDRRAVGGIGRPARRQHPSRVPAPEPLQGPEQGGPCCQLPQRPPREPAVVRASSASARKAQGQRLRRTKADPAGAARAGIVPAGAKRGPAGWGGADGRGLGAWAPAAVFYRQARAAFPEMWQWRFPPGRGGALG